MKKLREKFEEVETTKEYDGYYYQVAEVISIVVLESLCGLKNMKQVHQWATNERMREFLRKELGIERIPCYYWFLCLLKLVKPESLNRCLKKWVERLLPADRKAVSVALDGKTIRSTEKMDRYESPLHIISAQPCEMGITPASRSTEGKINEISAVQELLKELDISGCLVMADALNCQKKAAKLVVDGRGTLSAQRKRQPYGTGVGYSGLCAGRFPAEIHGYQVSGKRGTGAESKRGQHLLQTILHGF